MNLDLQKLLLSYLVSDQELFIKVSPILKIDYFDPQVKNAVKFIKSYFDQYKSAPNADQVKAETGNIIETRSSMTQQEVRYAEDQLENFCKNKALEHAIFASAPLVGTERAGEIEKMIRDAITVGLHRNIGLDYFNDPELRLKMLSLNNKPIPTGLIKLDEYLGGGINRKEMIIFAAAPGVGKSLTMANISKNLLKQGLNVLYITLELAETIVAKRFDSMFSGIPQADILKNITQTSIEIKKQAANHGSLTIKRMPESSTNANHIRAYLKEFEISQGYLPDAICVDYMDLMAPVQQVSAENSHARDTYISEELRAIADMGNLLMITASQLNRGSQMLESIEDLSQAHIAGGISKVNTTDNLVGIIQDRAFKARSEMLFTLLKTRSSNGVGKQFVVGFNPDTLIMHCVDDDGPERSKTLANYVRGKITPSAEREQKPERKMTVNNIPFQV